MIVHPIYAFHNFLNIYKIYTCQLNFDWAGGASAVAAMGALGRQRVPWQQWEPHWQHEPREPQWRWGLAVDEREGGEGKTMGTRHGEILKPKQNMVG